MTKDQLTREAEEFVDRVIKLNREHVGVIDLTVEERAEVVQKAAAPFRALHKVGAEHATD